MWYAIVTRLMSHFMTNLLINIDCISTKNALKNIHYVPQQEQLINYSYNMLQFFV